MRRLIALLSLSFAGCAHGGATDDDPIDRDVVELPEESVENPPDGETIFPTEDADELDGEPPPADGGCTPSCTTCGAPDGCGGTCASGACTTGTCVSGKCIAPTHSHLAPGDYAFGSAWARGITWTIAAEDNATIRYTLDGSTPGPTSASKASPAQLFIGSSGTVIKWYADNGAREPVRSFTANIATTGQTAYGFIVEKTNLGGNGPVIVVAPGATVSGLASYQAWTGSTCPGCRMQLVYGVGTASAGCLYDWSPGNWSGTSGTGSLTLKAPSAPGVYDVNVTYTLELSCASGVAENQLGIRPTASIGKIVVR